MTDNVAAPIIYAQSSRLTLRQLCRQSDIEPIQHYLSDFDVSKWMAASPFPLPDRYAHDYVDRALQAQQRDVLHKCAIVENRSQTIVGVVGCAPFGNDGKSLSNADRLELSYWLGKAYWCRGYATEAVRLMIEYMRTRVAADTIFIALVQADNRASINVLNKVGFRHSDAPIFWGDCLARGESVRTTTLQLSYVDYINRPPSPIN